MSNIDWCAHRELIDNVISKLDENVTSEDFALRVFLDELREIENATSAVNELYQNYCDKKQFEYNAHQLDEPDAMKLPKDYDKYFHCMAACQASREGDAGSYVAIVGNILREIHDVVTKSYKSGNISAEVEDSLGDLKADLDGIMGMMTESCSDACIHYRDPKHLKLLPNKRPDRK
ncbi:MAG: hypothetical protein HQK99_17770 [Nitrospirae bacterium]|nr:hypothetical protein [Nitrospirota bacterium]